MPKIKLTDIIILSLFFTACVSFPFSRLNAPVWVQYTLRLSLQVILLISYFLCIRKYKIKLYGNISIKNLLFMIPLILVMVINLLTMPFADIISFNEASITSGVFFFELALAIIQPINEEIVFRLFIHSQLPIKNRLVKILVSSAIFGLIHLLNFFFNSFDVQVLIQVAYTFGLGLALGFIYEYGGSIITCMSFHVLYNFFNTTIFAVLYSVGFSNIYMQYYLPVGLIALAVVIYMALLYVFYLRKQNKEDYVWN